MTDYFEDFGDDFWDNPALLQLASVSSTNTANTNANANNVNRCNPRKRKLDENNNQNYHNHNNKRRRLSNEMIEIGPDCNHKLPMVKRISRKNNANRGKAFWCCSQSQQNQCRAFMWDNEWQRNRNKQPKNAYSLLMKKNCVLSTELLCVDPMPLVQVSVHPYDECLIDGIRLCQNARWNKEARKWIIPLSEHSKLITNIKKICGSKQYIFKMDVIPQQIIKNVQKWKMNQKSSKIKEEMDKNDDCLQSLPLKLRSSMYEFQKEGVRFVISKGGRCLIADEMGLGKSIQAIAAAYYYYSEWPLLIITPSSLTLTWKMEILKWLKNKIFDKDINIIKKSSDAMLDYDTKSGRNKPICAITILSYGLAVRKQAELSDNKHLFGVIICDESHALKNFKTQRCKVLLPLIKKNIKRAILLSGTPTNNRPSELHTQIDALRPSEFMSFKHYSIRYCEGQSSKFGWIANGAMHLNELHAVIKHRVMIRRLKKEVLTQLPDKIRSVVNIECDKKMCKKIQKKLEKHEAMKETMSQMIGDGDDEMMNECDLDKNALFDRSNKTMLELYSLTGRSKIVKIKEYVYDLFESGQKFLVFAHHKEVMDGIEECVTKKCKTQFIRIDGNTKADKRQFAVDKFQKCEHVRIAILSITAAGTGLTLTAATSVVFAELYWGPTALLQCEDRAHRIGQESVVNIVYMLGNGSLDDTMWPMISKKMEVVSKTLTGKHIRMEVEEYNDEFIKKKKNYHTFCDKQTKITEMFQKNK